MLYFAQILLQMQMISSQIIFDFNIDANLKNWRIQDDVVMGGRSNGNFGLNKDGYGEFSGRVSLENNGGFSSVRYFPETISLNAESKIRLKVKGDGSKYQLRIKQDTRAYYSYIAYFDTTPNEWQTIEVELSEMYPSWRGRRLSGPNFSHTQIQEVAFLIGNKKAQDFRLLIDKIELVD